MAGPQTVGKSRKLSFLMKFGTSGGSFCQKQKGAHPRAKKIFSEKMYNYKTHAL